MMARRVTSGRGKPEAGSQNLQILNLRACGIVSAFKSGHPKRLAINRISARFDSDSTTPWRAASTAPKRRSESCTPGVFLLSTVRTE